MKLAPLSNNPISCFSGLELQRMIMINNLFTAVNRGSYFPPLRSWFSESIPGPLDLLYTNLIPLNWCSAKIQPLAPEYKRIRSSVGKFFNIKLQLSLCSEYLSTLRIITAYYATGTTDPPCSVASGPNSILDLVL